MTDPPTSARGSKGDLWRGGGPHTALALNPMSTPASGLWSSVALLCKGPRHSHLQPRPALVLPTSSDEADFCRMDRLALRAVLTTESQGHGCDREGRKKAGASWASHPVNNLTDIDTK